ncbi:MAG: ergothioneine biosynthesis protein EgtB, partial [Hyphomicrobiaceae bacterium]
LPRPSSGEFMAYRAPVDEGLGQLLDGPRAGEPEIVRLVELGINHEQQHQELMLTDILALFAASPIAPAYLPTEDDTPSIAPAPPRWLAIDGGKLRVGHDGHGFAWDNEGPAHDVLIGPFRVADRLVTNAEWLEFMADGGYREPLLWLADGWGAVQREGWEAPGYWRRIDGAWHQTTLHGRAPVEPAAPVAHVSYFEADAFARWAGARLPTEHEWEAAVARLGVRSGERGATRLAPSPCAARLDHRLHQAFGDVWQWTQSAYLPYPGYRPPKGAIGEYNGKFMVSQHVLRGSSAITAAGHARVTYRNFFYPHQRWQMAGVRLAEAP